ncbi:MAG: hypothetical protein NC489_45585 [Ruminococcus flavefaciens]|nr:hypothetical protein [Ruminococcus flavefaciens]
MQEMLNNYETFFYNLSRSAWQHTAVIGETGSGIESCVSDFICIWEKANLLQYDIRYIKLPGTTVRKDFEEAGKITIVEDECDICDVFQEVMTEMIRRRKMMWEDCGCSNATRYNLKWGGNIPLTVLIIDRFSTWIEQCKYRKVFEDSLDSILECGEDLNMLLYVVQEHEDINTIGYMRKFPVRICYPCDMFASSLLLNMSIPQGDSILKYDCSGKVPTLYQFKKGVSYYER